MQTLQIESIDAKAAALFHLVIQILRQTLTGCARDDAESDAMRRALDHLRKGLATLGRLLP